MNCPKCNSERVKKCGKGRKGQQKHQCLDCRKKFSEAAPLSGSRTPLDAAVQALRMLCEGVSVRATERLTGLKRDTILRLMYQAGEQCERFLRMTIRSLPVADVQADEVWGFVFCKEKTREAFGLPDDCGDCYCFTAIERSTKLLITWHAGKRSAVDTRAFMWRLNDATSGRFQLSTDGWGPYQPYVPEVIGSRVDHGLLVKQYGSEKPVGAHQRYSPPAIIRAERKAAYGNPDMNLVCTSHVERSNLSVRMGIRRFTRLTNAHSKKWANHEAMLALWFAYYNFCRVHMTIKTTPAVKAGLTDKPWTLERLLTEAARFAVVA